MNNIYYFIDKFDKNEIFSLDKKINIIYRNYEEKKIEKVIEELAVYCKLLGKKLYLSNNIKIAQRYNLDGLYIPFNKILTFIKNLKNLKIIGSAHNFKNKIKEKQGCKEIFISPIFHNPKNELLEIVKFNNLNLATNINTIALGGINENFRKLIHKVIGFAGILDKKTGLRLIRPFKYFYIKMQKIQ